MHPRVPSTMLNTSITSPEVSASNISPEAEEGDNNRDEIVAIANEQLSIFQKLMQGSWLEHQCLDGHVATNSTSQNQQLSKHDDFLLNLFQRIWTRICVIILMR